MLGQDPIEQLSPGWGELHELAAPVLRIRFPSDQPESIQAIEARQRWS